MQCSLNNEGTYELAEKILDLIIRNNRQSLIDLCCCHAELTGRLKFTKRKYIDVIPRELRLPSEQPHFVQADVLKEHPLFEEHWQVATCLDGIEHVTKEQGVFLKNRMMQIADICIIFTPADAWMMEPKNTQRYLNDPECHKSLWSPSDFENWSSILFPNWHKTLGIGAFWSWYNKNEDMALDLARVVKEIT